MVRSRRAAPRPQVIRHADWAARMGESRVHVFCGPESLLRDQALKELEAFVGQGSGVEVDRFNGGEANLSQVANAALTVGLFNPRRLVILREADRCGRAGKKDKEAFYAALESLPDGCCVVATSPLLPYEFVRKNEFCKGVSARGMVVEFSHPRPAEAMNWILGASAEQKVKLTPEAGEFLLSKVGPHLAELSREMEKIALWAAPGDTIDVEILREMIRSGNLGDTWEFCDAVVAGHAADALRNWDAIQTQEPVPRLIWMLQQKTREGLLKTRPGPEAARLERLLTGLCDLEFGIKSGQVRSGRDGMALEILITDTRSS